ncbi:hypothetical protein JG688_00015282 [Phytophthora aleatoria]|uniref:Uncharacterized protein n=1 Tax=Phytophthora aleatoria TaxID=2496075 RepID=A0A8J5II45_9STRA|nr:hypothetical protein JG688_00015282 [Phytophthora aleatoria]
MSWWDAVPSRVLLNSMHHIAKKVGVNLEVILGICFGTMFDGWSNRSMHLLLCTASSKQMAFFSYRTDRKMQMHTSSSSMVCWMCITRNSTWARLSSVTTAVPTTKLGVPLVGYASHLLNLAVNRYLAEYEPLLMKVNNLMSKLCQVNNFAELAKSTGLYPIKWNYEMELKLRNATACPPYTPSNQDCGGRRGASADWTVASQAPCAAETHEEVLGCDQEAAVRRD